MQFIRLLNRKFLIGYICGFALMPACAGWCVAGETEILPPDPSPTDAQSRMDANLRRLCQMTRDPQIATPLPVEYSKVENEVAEKLCTEISGKTTAQIEAILGQPYTITSMPRHPLVWIYYLGLCPKIVRLEISDGKCTKACFNDFEVDPSYLDWRRQSLLNDSINKTKIALRQEQGPPVDIKQMITPSNSVWTYKLGSRYIKLFFKGDLCVDSEYPNWVQYGGMSPPDWECAHMCDLDSRDDGPPIFTLPSGRTKEFLQTHQFTYYSEDFSSWKERYHLYFKAPPR